METKERTRVKKMSNLSKRMLFSYLLSEIDTSKYNKKELQKKVKSIHNNIFNKGKEKENENKSGR